MAEPNVLASRVSGGQSEYPMHRRIPDLTVRRVLAEKPGGLDCVDAGCQLSSALRLMVDRSLEAVLVLDAGLTVGVLSLREFASAAVAGGEPVLAQPVANLVAPCHCMVSPEDSAQACLQLMLDNNLDFVVVQVNGEPVALLSKDQLLLEILTNYQKIFRELALDQQLLFLRGTYSC